MPRQQASNIEPLKQRPTFIAMKGFPGMGKSYVAGELARALRWPLIDKDDVLERLRPLVGEGEWWEDVKGAAYDIVWSVARRQLSAGVSVIADVTMMQERSYIEARRVATDNSARFFVVETVLDKAEWFARLAKRHADEPTSYKSLSGERVERLLRENPSYSIDQAHHLQLDARKPVNELVAIVQERLR